jgi:hypothetical protein
MAMRRARRYLGWLLLPLWSWSACREVSLCDGDACAGPALNDTEGGMAGQTSAEPRAGADAGATQAPAAMGGAAGQPDPPDAGASPGGQGQQGPSCRAGTAECDESSFTVCETPTTFSFRNCGGCGERCEGSCISGKCKPAEVIFEHNAEDFVADSSRAFARFEDKVYRINLKTGEPELMADGFPNSTKLVLGANQLYVYADFDELAFSVGFDSKEVTTEPFEPTSFGATKDGVYYETYEEALEDEPGSPYALWFRPTNASTPELLRQGAEYQIVDSSRASVLLVQRSDDEAELLLVQGRELRSLGPLPTNTVDRWSGDISALVTADGAAILVTSEQAPSGYELVWLKLDQEPKYFAVEPEVEQSELVHAPDGVALTLKDRSNTFVRLYTGEGPFDVPLGIGNNSTLAWVDDHHFWYTAYFTFSALPHFQRARQFELSDLKPD